MPAITFQCYACNQVLQVEAEHAGRKAKCSQCGTILTVPLTGPSTASEGIVATIPAPASAPPPPELPREAGRDRNARDDDRDRPRDRDDWDDEPARRRDHRDDDRPRRRYADDYDDSARPTVPKWDKVRLGTLLVFIGLCVMLGALGVSVLGTLVSFVSFGAWSIFIRLGATVIFLGTIVAIVGHVFWLFVFTNRRGAMGFAIAALAVAGVYVLVQLVALAQVYSNLWGPARSLGLLAGLLRAAHLMMIAFYLRALAEPLRDRSLDNSAGVIIILSGCLAGVDLFFTLVWLMTGLSGIVSGVLHLVIGVLAVVTYIFTLLAMHRGKRILDDRYGPAARRDW